MHTDGIKTDTNRQRPAHTHILARDRHSERRERIHPDIQGDGLKVNWAAIGFRSSIRLVSFDLRQSKSSGEIAKSQGYRSSAIGREMSKARQGKRGMLLRGIQHKKVNVVSFVIV